MKKIFNNLLITNIVPVVLFNLLFFLCFDVVRDHKIYVTILWVGNIAVFPILLTILDLIIAFKEKQYIFFKYFIFILLSMVIGNVLNYINWGITSRMLFTPDGETLLIVGHLAILGLKFVIASCILAQIILVFYRLFKKQV